MKKILVGLALFFGAGTIHAEGAPNWNFVGLSYQSADFEGETLNGLGVSGSALIGEDFFVSGGLSSVGTEVEGIDLDLKSTSLGLGYRYGASETTDIFGVISYESAEVEVSFQGESASADGNGHGIQLGIRSLVTNEIEIVASISQDTIEDESETTFSISALYHINEQFGIGADYGQSDDVDTLSLSAVLFF